jgi:hypothetical protein
MKYVIWLVGGIAISATVLIYANAEVPGGEKRYQQFLRLTMERQSIPGMPSISFNR